MTASERMKLALVGSVVCGFFFALGMGQQQTLAAPIGNCEKSCCEPFYSWWIKDNPGGNKCFSAQVVDKTPADVGGNITHATKDIYLPAQTPGGCKLVGVGAYDRWEWEDSDWACAEDKGGGRPSPQGVQPKGTSKLNSAKKTRNVCE